MSTLFPSSLDTFTNPNPATALAANTHAQRHIDLQDSIAALEAKVGVNSSADTSSLDYKVSMAAASFGGTYDPATHGLYIGPAFGPSTPLSQSIVKNNTSPDPDNPMRAVFELQHDGANSYIFHLTQGPNMEAGAHLIGLGIDGDGGGLFVNNKKTGRGITITQNSTITGGTAYGMMVNGGPGAAPAVFMQQNNIAGSLNAQPVLVMHAYQSFDVSQRLMEWRKPDGSYTGTLVGRIRSYDGALLMDGAGITVSGGDITAAAVSGVGGSFFGVSSSLIGSGAQFSLSNNGASTTTNKRRYKWTCSFDMLVLSGRNDSDTSTGDLMYWQNTTQNVGFAGQNSFGGGTKVIAIPNAGTVPSSDPTAGGVLYVESGALKYRGSSGTVTVLAPA